MISLILVLIFLMVYLGIWINEKKYERESNLERAWVVERILEYGNYGMIYNELGKHGLFVLKFAWKRFNYVIEWDKHLILISTNRKLEPFILRKDEIGLKYFEGFKKFAISKLQYRKIESYSDLIQ